MDMPFPAGLFLFGIDTDDAGLGGAAHRNKRRSAAMDALIAYYQTLMGSKSAFLDESGSAVL